MWYGWKWKQVREATEVKKVGRVAKTCHTDQPIEKCAHWKYHDISKQDELKKELESKKNHKFQEKYILIVQILLNEEPVVEYRPSFMKELELDAFFQSNRIA
ncbi:11571_t:CDS:2 [Ambispora leptoticha]|uniref:11571_t:CDS:1 n=1 Tax=Ambispora leptoticha TaxID=144679 RepID=A0A9N9FC81_9GLOM|nr:11571_t:CDS:2 [Ambispora leptoticha]